MTKPLISVILPTYNEAENIAAAIARIHAVLGDASHEIIVSDDDSPDKTWQHAMALTAEYPVKVLRRTTDRGLYPAVMDGFAAARGEYLAVMDADLQHDEKILPAMLEKARAGAKLVVASRYTKGGGVENWNAFRLFLSRSGNRFASLMLRRPCTDLMSGFFIVERQAFEETKPKLRPKGFKILMDILQNLPAGAATAEEGYVFRPRTAGESKLSLKVAWQAFMGLYELSLGRYIPFAALAAIIGLLLCGIIFLTAR